MLYPGLSPIARAIHGRRAAHWDDFYRAPDGTRPSLLLDFGSSLFGLSGVQVANPLAGARIGRPGVDGLADGLVIEPARSNLVTEAVANATAWTAVGTPSLTELGGTVLGLFPGLAIASGGANWHRAQAPAVSYTAGTDHSLTLWYAGGSANYAKIILYNSGTTPATNLEVAGVPGALVPSVQGNGTIFDAVNSDLGGGIWRLRFGFRLNSPVTSAWGVSPGSATIGADVVAYAMQIEEGAAATGYIATSGAVQSRVADDLSLSAGAWAGSAAGSLVLTASAETALDCPFAELEDGTGATLALLRDSSGVITARHTGTGGTVTLSTTATVARAAPARIGLGWDATGLSLSVNGSAAVTGAAPEMLSPATLRLNAPGIGETYGPALIDLLRHYKARLSATDLTAMTA